MATKKATTKKSVEPAVVVQFGGQTAIRLASHLAKKLVESVLRYGLVAFYRGNNVKRRIGDRIKKI